MFSGTLRFNLDPFDQHDDETLWAALEKVQLKDALMAQEATADTNINTKTYSLPTPTTILHQTVAEKGQNFSVGQRQLISLVE